jgi:hypothetical protein
VKSFFQKAVLKITLFRMWAAGAVCFFAAWGWGDSMMAAPSGADELIVGAAFSLNIILSLIIVMVLCDLLIVNPVIRMATGQKALGEEKRAWMLILKGPLNIIRVMAIMLLIVGSYYVLNTAIIRMFGMDENMVPVPLEPILFGILYGLYYLLIETMLKLIFRKRKPV